MWRYIINNEIEGNTSMASTGLEGAFALSAKAVDAAVTQTSAGAYALGNTKDGTFYISYVGRSDSDLNARLKQWVGKYPQFKASYFGSPKAAFEKECHLWHDFGGPEGRLDNTIHPDRPANSGWGCPRCRIFS